jgi:aminoglycoside phosphotransferase family enzyme
LTGPYAYKIKKAVDLQFLDFMTLDARRFYCDEELRLNRPFAPSIYLEVVAVAGTVEVPAIGGAGPVLEYAVKMRQFPQTALLSDMLAHGVLAETHIEALAEAVASFHRGTLPVLRKRGPCVSFLGTTPATPRIEALLGQLANPK